jgi:hypothetical protein
VSRLHEQLGIAALIIGILCYVSVPLELGVRGFHVPGLQRQTIKTWRDRYGARWSALFWGLHLGVGVLTIRVTALFWVALLLVASSGSMLLGATLVVYGIGLGLNLVAGTFILEGGDLGRPIAALNLLPRVRLVTAVVLSFVGALLIASGAFLVVRG